MNFTPLLRTTITAVAVLVAVIAAYLLWRDYMYSPWTRDGRVRANIINVASDVSGLVTDIRVKDNQRVNRGDVLYVIDPVRFRDALALAEAQLERTTALVAQAEAQQAQRQSEWDMRRAQAGRRASLAGDVITAEARSDTDSGAQQAAAAYRAATAGLQQAKADLHSAEVARDIAKLNLERSTVRAPVDGFVANLNLFPGDYATAGAARMALIDAHSFWVYGYFEETKLPGVRVGDAAKMELMAGRVTLYGHVESIASGITDRDNPTGNQLLADVNPVFTWIRLAQRVPVRIAIDRVPPDLHLAAGMTCTVILSRTKTHP
jgi:multidrug resistance efflux pump